MRPRKKSSIKSDPKNHGLPRLGVKLFANTKNKRTYFQFYFFRYWFVLFSISIQNTLRKVFDLTKVNIDANNFKKTSGSEVVNFHDVTVEIEIGRHKVRNRIMEFNILSKLLLKV
jgi:hypothetical protein